MQRRSFQPESRNTNAMSESLRDQLLKAGFAAKPNSEPRAKPAQRAYPSKPAVQRPQRTHPANPSARPPRANRSDIDLAKAYALRDKTEREARERAQREAEQRAREKKERKQKLANALNGAALNDANADIPRHFPHTNKIRRIYVTAEQLPRLNGGELAIVQFAGRYLLVARETALAAQAIDTDTLILLCDPHAVDEDGVPADLVW
jgi:uncharacterized protein YaiL (DUF2058 family)